MLATVFLLGIAGTSVLRAAPRPDVVLVSVDTLRADALGSYGADPPMSPEIDALARRGVLFEDTLTTVGKTGPAFASLFSSLYPPSHGARRNGVPMRSDVPVLAELLAAAGYQTGAFLSNWTLRSELAAVHRGFDVFDTDFDRKRNAFGASERSAHAVSAAAVAWLRSRDRTRPAFVWAHFSEPHTPYEEHPGFLPPRPPATDGSGRLKRWRYASEVAFTDHAVGQLLATIERTLESPPLVVFLSDHGESMGEHDYWGHGRNALSPSLRIPLVFVGPRVPAGRRLATPASIVDVLPTLLNLLDLPQPPGIAGISLAPSWSEAPFEHRARYVFADRHTAVRKKAREGFQNPLEIGIVRDQVKAIFDFSKRELRYYDLRLDPGENRPLSAPPDDGRPPLGRQLANWYRDLPKYTGLEKQLSEEDARQLRSMGYVDGD